MEYAKADCLACDKKYCPQECFNAHPGSRIALGKLVNEASDKKNLKVHIAGDVDGKI